MAEEDVETRLRRAQTQLSAATARRARSEVEEENARAALAEAKEALKEFGIEKSEDLVRVRDELEAELEFAISEVEKALELAEASSA